MVEVQDPYSDLLCASFGGELIVHFNIYAAEGSPCLFPSACDKSVLFLMLGLLDASLSTDACHHKLPQCM